MRIATLRRREGMLLAGALLIALGIRLYFVLMPGQFAVRSDASGYDAAARRLLAAGDFSFPIGADLWAHDVFREDAWEQYLARPRNSFSMPGYALFLAGVYRFSGTGENRFVAVRIAQAVVSLLGLLALFLVVLEVVDRRAAWVALALAAIYPPGVWSLGYLLSESVFAALVMLQVLATVWAAKRSTTPSYLVLGAATAAAAYVRPAALLLPILLVVHGLWRRGTEGTLGREGPAFALRLAALSVVVVALMAPWAARNQSLYGAFAPLSSASALGHVERVAGWYCLGELPTGVLAQNMDVGAYPDDHRMALAVDAWARARIARVPWRNRLKTWIAGVAINVFRSLTSPYLFFSDVVTWPDPRFLLQLALLAFAALGAWSVRTNPLAACLFVGVPAYFVAAHALTTFIWSRYLYPSMPCVLALAGIGGLLVYDSTRRGTRSTGIQSGARRDPGDPTTSSLATASGPDAGERPIGA